MQTPQRIAIVGSGLVGTLLAIYLKKQGHTVHVYDRSADIRTVEFSGRSINLVMSDYFKLLPHLHQTDGFFAAILQKK